MSAVAASMWEKHRFGSSARLPCALLILAVGCGRAEVQGGAGELQFEGGALDGSEDAALVAAEAALAADADAARGEAAGDGTQQAVAKRAPLEVDTTTPIPQLIEAMGLTYDESNAMLQLPDDQIRLLAAARKAQRQFDATDLTPPTPLPDGRLAIRFRHLSLDALDDEAFEDLMDSLVGYAGDRDEGVPAPEFPASIQALNGKDVALAGYMIPIEWNDAHVLEFMLVRDLLACCFGGAPQPDEWTRVRMVKGKTARYYPFVPVIVHGHLTISGISDSSGYAAGCYHLDATQVSEED